MNEAQPESRDVLVDEFISASTLDLVPEPVFAFRIEEGSRFRCVAANRAALTATGFSDHKVVVIGKTLEEIVGPEEAALSAERFRTAMKQEAPIYAVRTIDLPAGRLTFEITTAAIRDDEGRCTHIVTCSRIRH